jgi:membrane protein implicated in regulation of membrane protease activity
MRLLRIRLIEMVKGMGLLAVCVVGVPLLILYGLLWLACAGLIFVAGAAVLVAPIWLAVWGWDMNHWLGMFIIACYALAYLGWKVMGERLTDEFRARGWLRTRAPNKSRPSN